mmetsp:Transcript_92745/g.267812  ORF Transcript_92745/g.267812 Transcript_92745/m.267812 type:complete len:309 (-) Transcript_92745:287-1213(-)
MTWITKQAGGDDSPEAVHAMHGEGVDHIVDLQAIQQHRPCLVAQARHEADDARLPRLHDGARRGDGHQAGEDAVAERAHVQALGREDAGAEVEDDEACDARRQRGIDSDQGSRVRRLDVMEGSGASRVEAIPTEPQEERTEHTKWHVVRQELVCQLFVVAILARADKQGADDGCNAPDEVNNTASGEVKEGGADLGLAVPVVQPALAAPHPIDHGGIDDRGHKHSKGTKPPQLRSLGHRAADDGAACGTERALEEPNAERLPVVHEAVHEKASAAHKLVRLVDDPQSQRVAQAVPAKKPDRHDKQVLA